MNSFIIKKKGIKVVKGEKIAMISADPFLSMKDDCFADILDPELVEKTYETIKEYKDNYQIMQRIDFLFRVINMIKKDGTDNINTLMNKIENVESKRDLIEVYRTLISLIDDKKADRINGLYRSFPDLTISIIVKRIIETYVEKKIDSNDRNMIEMLAMFKLKGEPHSKSKIMKFLSIEPSQKSLNNNVYYFLYRTVNDMLDRIFMSSSSLCFDCSNCYNCIKFRDYDNKDIMRYDFVTDGYEIKRNGEFEKLVVTGCKFYKKATRVENKTDTECNQSTMDVAMKH